MAATIQTPTLWAFDQFGAKKKVLDYIEKGKAEGARLLLGGGTPSHLDKGFYVEPTVFVDVTNDMTIAQEEIFGPVLCVIAYDTESDAIQIANDSIFGLSGGVWSGDEERAIKVARQFVPEQLMSMVVTFMPQMRRSVVINKAALVEKWV